VGGAAILAREYFTKGFYNGLNELSAASLKTILVAGSILPSGVQNTASLGYGTLALDKVLPFVDNKLFRLSVNEVTVSAASGSVVYAKEVTIAPGRARGAVGIVAALGWTDPAATLGAKNKIVQNMILSITAPNQGQYLAESSNNVQKISIAGSDVRAGTYTVKVTAEFLYAEQDISVVIRGPFNEVETVLLCCPDGSFVTPAGCMYPANVIFIVLSTFIVVGLLIAAVASLYSTNEGEGPSHPTSSGNVEMTDVKTVVPQ
jgi:hypothetical protein